MRAMTTNTGYKGKSLLGRRAYKLSRARPGQGQRRTGNAKPPPDSRGTPEQIALQQ